MKLKQVAKSIELEITKTKIIIKKLNYNNKYKNSHIQKLIFMTGVDFLSLWNCEILCYDKNGKYLYRNK